MTTIVSRLRRIVEKSSLRAALAWRVLTTFEDTVPRSTVRVSFSQGGEDLLAWWILDSLGIRCPRYLDIGAHDPLRLSNTALFYALGGHGINIEADPVLFERFPRARPRDVNLNIGIAPITGELPFFQMSDPSLNTFDAAEAARLARDEGIRIVHRVNVPVRPIRDVLAEHDFTPDFLSLDTEGFDLPILADYDFEARRPAVICVETITFSTRGLGEKRPEIASLLATRGYRPFADTHVNTLFVDARR
jgi:FkbM family methyltransferase